MKDEEFYLEATNEVDEGNQNPAIWAKALALTEGDEEKAKYKYIQLRVERLVAGNVEHSQPLRDKKDIPVTINEATEEISESIEDARPDNELNNEALMKRYGITYTDEKYIYNNYKYDTFSNAINYAQLDRKKENVKKYTISENLPLIKSFIKPIKLIIGLAFLLSFIGQLNNLANGFTAPFYFVAAFVQGGIAFLLLKSALSANKNSEEEKPMIDTQEIIVHGVPGNKGVCMECGQETFINYGDAYHTYCKKCSQLKIKR